MSRPCAFNTATRPVSATVGDGLTRSRVAENGRMVVTGWNWSAIVIEGDFAIHKRIEGIMEDNDGKNWFAEDAATFGDRLAAARSARGMTQKALARRLGVSLKTLDGWENDIREPRANRLQMLAGVLDVSISWLLTGEGQGVGSETEAGSVRMSELLHEMRMLRVEMQRSVARLGVLEKRLGQAAGEAHDRES